MSGTAPQIHSMSTDETRSISIDMSDLLDGSETLIGMPEIQSSADFLADDEQINSSPISINGRSVVAGKAILFSAVCAVPGRYLVEALCQTSAGQTIEGSINIRVVRSRF